MKATVKRNIDIRHGGKTHSLRVGHHREISDEIAEHDFLKYAISVGDVEIEKDSETPVEEVIDNEKDKAAPTKYGRKEKK